MSAISRPTRHRSTKANNVAANIRPLRNHPTQANNNAANIPDVPINWMLGPFIAGWLCSVACYYLYLLYHFDYSWMPYVAPVVALFSADLGICKLIKLPYIFLVAGPLWIHHHRLELAAATYFTAIVVLCLAQRSGEAKLKEQEYELQEKQNVRTQRLRTLEQQRKYLHHLQLLRREQAVRRMVVDLLKDLLSPIAMVRDLGLYLAAGIVGISAYLKADDILDAVKKSVVPDASLLQQLVQHIKNLYCFILGSPIICFLLGVYIGHFCWTWFLFSTIVFQITVLQTLIWIVYQCSLRYASKGWFSYEQSRYKVLTGNSLPDANVIPVLFGVLFSLSLMENMKMWSSEIVALFAVHAVISLIFVIVVHNYDVAQGSMRRQLISVQNDIDQADREFHNSQEEIHRELEKDERSRGCAIM